MNSCSTNAVRVFALGGDHIGFATEAGTKGYVVAYDLNWMPLGCANSIAAACALVAGQDKKLHAASRTSLAA